MNSPGKSPATLPPATASLATPSPATPMDRLKVLINSSTPIVVMETIEELRAVRMVRVACTDLNLASFEWTIASGLARCGANSSDIQFENALPPGGYDATRHNEAEQNSKAIYNSQDPAQMLGNLEAVSIEATFILKDFHRHLEDAIVVRKLRDVGQKFSANRRTVVITGPRVVIPPELAGLVEFFDLALPDRQRLRQIVDETLVRIGKTHTVQRKLDAAGLDTLAASLLGLTEEEAERAISQAVVARYVISADCVTDVLESKKALLKRSEMLEFVDTSNDMASVGGLENLKSWLAQRRNSWNAQAVQFGLDPAKGVIILGVQGCGKSLCARAIAGEWNIPLVKFDTAAIYDKFIGETEKRIQKVFKVAEGADSASADAGVSSRLLASFLSWMQERKAPVFVAATCNNVTVLPPELIRKGRFDELFFVDLPSVAERKQIFSIQLTKRRRNPADYDLDRVATAAKGFSGAEIESAVQTALYAAFARKQELSSEDLLTALSSTVPLSVTRAEEIDELRAWAKDRAVWASMAEKKREGA
jgi:ATPase family associated with various cellular activities (AAA)